MKRLLAAIAAVCLLGATPPANYNAFGVTMLQRLSAQSPDANVFISPVSLGVALAMTADGAAGSTRAQMLSVLRIAGTNLAQANAALIASLQSNHDAQVGIADALWLRNDMPPRPAYVTLLQHDYAAQAQALHFGDPSAAQTINAWTKQHTLGLIDRLVDRTDPLDFLYITNALAFQANWTTPFNPQETSAQSFTNASGTKQTVQMMARTGTFQIATLPSYRILELPYGSGGYAAYVLLPNGPSAASTLSSLSDASFERAVQALHGEYVRLSLPRFTAEYQASLADALGALGMTDAFGSSADFSQMTSQRVRISGVTHETYVRVDEQGTTAAAATSVGITMLAMRTSPTPFIVNKPFILAIRDEHTGALLFIGVINTLST